MNLSSLNLFFFVGFLTIFGTKSSYASEPGAQSSTLPFAADQEIIKKNMRHLNKKFWHAVTFGSLFAVLSIGSVVTRLEYNEPKLSHAYTVTNTASIPTSICCFIYAAHITNKIDQQKKLLSENSVP